MALRLFTDIDDTLMSTARKVPLDQRSAVGAVSADGEPSSFMTPRHVELWKHLSAVAESIVPVTARSTSALSRIRLPMRDGAVVDFGATIVAADGTVDAEWLERMRAESIRRGDASVFKGLHQSLVSHDVAGKVELREVNGVTAFINFRGAPGSSSQARVKVEAFLAEQGVRAGYYLHITDRDVTVLPACVSKGAALDYLIAQRGWLEDLLIGAGDSLSDCSFIARTDFALLPTQSRAFKALGQTAAGRGELP